MIPRSTSTQVTLAVRVMVHCTSQFSCSTLIISCPRLSTTKKFFTQRVDNFLRQPVELSRPQPVENFLTQHVENFQHPFFYSSSSFRALCPPRFELEEDTPKVLLLECLSFRDYLISFNCFSLGKLFRFPQALCHLSRILGESLNFMGVLFFWIS